MTQKKQDKRGVWFPDYRGLYDSTDPLGVKPPNSDGTEFTIAGSFGTNAVVAAFSDLLVDATAIDGLPANANGIVFNQTAGNPFTVQQDASRKKVLYSTQDGSNYNSCLRYLFDAMPENTWAYFGHWTKVRLRISGADYTGYNQLKNDRFNSVNDINDGSGTQVKLHAEIQNGVTGETTTLLINEGDPDWPLGNQYGGLDFPLTDNEWFMLDGAIFTGTQGGNNARIIRRILKGGAAYIIEDAKSCRIYDTIARYVAFILQGYMGNWGPTIGTANEGPNPDSRELWRSSFTFIHGEKRIDLSTSLDTATAAWRQNIPWISWNGSITATRDYRGLPSGTHTIYARVIDGFTSAGWDNVIGYTSWVVTK